MLYCLGLMCIKDMDEDALVAADLAFSTSSATGQEIQLSSTHTRITPANRQDYVRLALHYRYVASKDSSQ